VKRRSLVLAPLAAGLAVPGHAADAHLPAPASLADELAAALAGGKPLVLMASLPGCPFCRVVRNSYLAPLREAGQPVVQLDTGSSAAVRDFRGQASTHDKLLRAWGLKVWPTVLFFGRGGKEVAERLVGASIPDFYGAYLDERLRTASRSLV